MELQEDRFLARFRLALAQKQSFIALHHGNVGRIFGDSGIFEMNVGRITDFVGKVPDFDRIMLDFFGRNQLYFGIFLDYSEIHRVFNGKIPFLYGNMSVNSGRIAEYFGIGGEFEALLSKLWVKANALRHP